MFEEGGIIADDTSGTADRLKSSMSVAFTATTTLLSYREERKESCSSKYDGYKPGKGV